MIYEIAMVKTTAMKDYVCRNEKCRRIIRRGEAYFKKTTSDGNGNEAKHRYCLKCEG